MVELSQNTRHTNISMSYSMLVSNLNNKIQAVTDLKHYLDRVSDTSIFDFMFRTDTFTKYLEINRQYLQHIVNVINVEKNTDLICCKICNGFSEYLKPQEDFKDLLFNGLIIPETWDYSVEKLDKRLYLYIYSELVKFLNVVKETLDNVYKVLHTRNPELVESAYVSDDMFFSRIVKAFDFYVLETWDVICKDFIVDMIQSNPRNIDTQSLFGDSFNVMTVDDKIAKDLEESNDMLATPMDEFNKVPEPTPVC